ncbi:hypothetical protein [Streptomyces sp. NPDC001480]|uniref:hypothetical protein n=1 Tax=Streptomyces sp. NPDC001480 TaxID=3364577 RepID=UPI0036BE10AB
MLDTLFGTQLTRHGKEIRLSEAQELPGRVGYAHVRRDDPARAVLAVERGRAVLLTEAPRAAETDLDRLSFAGREDDLGERYRAAAERMAAARGREPSLEAGAPRSSAVRRGAV